MSRWTHSVPASGTAPPGNSARSAVGSAFFAQFSSCVFKSAVTGTPPSASAIAGSATTAHVRVHRIAAAPQDLPARVGGGGVRGGNGGGLEPGWSCHGEHVLRPEIPRPSRGIPRGRQAGQGGDSLGRSGSSSDFSLYWAVRSA